VSCITCSDQAIPGRVRARLPGGMAAVEINGTTEEISLELCDAVESDRVLVHARVAIGKLSDSP
jgi:hydrogenase maturation factor